jgi:1,2-diacylglycerol 3-beta-galactosyltransferase
VGIVLRSFREVEDGVRRMLDPATLGEFRKNVGALENRAIFEIPEILDKLLRESATVKASQSTGAALETAVQRRSS